MEQNKIKFEEVTTPYYTLFNLTKEDGFLTIRPKARNRHHLQAGELIKMDGNIYIVYSVNLKNDIYQVDLDKLPQHLFNNPEKAYNEGTY